MTVSKQHTAVLQYPRANQKFPRTINVKTHLLDVNGFDWSVETVETLDDDLESCVALRYTNLKNADTSVWYCDATLFYTILNTDARKSLYWSEIVRLTPKNNCYTKPIILHEDFVEDKGFWNEENNCEIFISIQPFGEKGHKFYKRTVIDWNQNLENADCCIEVEGEKFFVGKATLVRHSKYFDSVFFGSDGVDMTPFVLTDASKHDFRLFLNYIHRCDNAKISDETVLLFIQIAVRLQSEGILAKAEKFVANSGFQLSMKIDLSETYQLPGLKDHCLHLLSDCCLADINNIVATSNYESIWSEDIRKATGKRLHAIANEQAQQLMAISNGFNPFQQQVNYGPPPSLFGHAPPHPQANPNLFGNPPPPPIRPPPAPRQRRAPVRRRAPAAVPQPVPGPLLLPCSR